MSADEYHVATCKSAELQGDPTYTEGDKDKVKPFINTSWVIADGERKGEMWFKDFYLTERALKFSLDGLRAAGFEGSDVTKCDMIVGNDATLVLGDSKPYNKVVKTEVKFVNKVGGGTPMEGAAVLTFAESMAARIQAEDAGKEEAASEVAFQ